MYITASAVKISIVFMLRKAYEMYNVVLYTYMCNIASAVNKYLLPVLRKACEMYNALLQMYYGCNLKKKMFVLRNEQMWSYI